IALVCPVLSSVFFFQAEDGIRDFHVTGVQTCALPISELAILTMAAWWRSSFEWWAHQPIAVKAGLDAGITEQIRLGDTPSFQQDDESVVYRFVRALLDTRQVPDELYQEAVRVLGAERGGDLVGIAGYYTLISMTINVFDIPPGDGSTVQFGR